MADDVGVRLEYLLASGQAEVVVLFDQPVSQREAVMAQRAWEAGRRYERKRLTGSEEK